MPTKKEISNLLFEELKAPMTELGFIGKKPELSFKRIGDGWELEVIGDIALFQLPVVRFQFNASIEWIEKILADGLPGRSSGFGKENTFTFDNTRVPNSSVNDDDFELKGNSYYSIIAEIFLTLLTSSVIPLLETCVDPEKADQFINDNPNTQNPIIRFPINQCLRGMIVRAVSDPSKLDEISEVYRSIAKKEGRYPLKEFDQLKAYLVQNYS